MPPVRPIPPAISGLSDQDLADQLRDLGVNLGPILPTTRRVYERRLFELQTGMKAAPSGGYEPVDDDDDEDEADEEDEESADEEVVIQAKQPRQRTTRTTRAEGEPRTEMRTEPRRVSPRKPLHPDLSSRRTPSPQSSKTKSEGGGGLPVWVKIFAILIIAAIVFLVVKNMEPDPASNIPDQIEINV